ncbi:MAG: NifB/NifX family molybdenum-iron cluster-binding protein [Polyangiaceae bacterium]|nr:NifB/NifX family molybdenum-iron cluster-binding protein [Polyangiaceae bacterium]
MRIGIPIEEDRGQDSLICPHFGGAPAFLVVDTDLGTSETLSNDHGHDAHGQCVPVDLLRDQRLDVMVVAGIGRGAIMKLDAIGVRVCQAGGETVRDCVAAVLASALPDFGIDMACAGHDQGHPGHYSD